HLGIAGAAAGAQHRGLLDVPRNTGLAPGGRGGDAGALWPWSGEGGGGCLGLMLETCANAACLRPPTARPSGSRLLRVCFGWSWGTSRRLRRRHGLHTQSLSEKVTLWLPNASPSIESWQS